MIKPLYPPRPKNAVSPNHIYQYEGMGMFAQPKLNGSQGVLYVDKHEMMFMNRHKEIITNVKMSHEEFRSLHSGTGQMIICGEYMNKNKKHINSNEFNHKYVLFDILMYNGVHLLGKSFEQRQQILDQIFPKYTNFDGFISKIDRFDNVYRVKNFDNGFTNLYENLVSIDMYEGLVLKKKRAPLEVGIRQDNNHLAQCKVRKPTKNYSF
jgi:hypothetical protein